MRCTSEHVHQLQLLETHNRHCPTCPSESVTFANCVLAIDGVIKEEFRCTTCGTAFWVVRKPII